MCLQQQNVLCSREGIEPVPGGALDCVRESSIPSFCWVSRGGGWFLAGNHCHDTSRYQVSPRHASPGSCLRSPSTRDPPSCLLTRPPDIPQIKCHVALFSRSPKPYLSSLHCRVVQVLEVPQELLPTVRVEGAREFSLGTGHNSHAHSSNASVGLAQLLLPIRLGCQRILPLLSLFNTSSRSLLSPPAPPPPPSSCSRFNQ